MCRWLPITVHWLRGSLSGKVYYEHKMKLSTANEVLAYCREKGYYLQLYVGDSIFD